MSATFLLKEGVVRCIGSGNETEIWRDPWLTTAPHNIRSSKPEDCTIWFVSDLIDPVHRLWKHDLLTMLFSEEEVNQIMQIPLTLNERPDGWKWIYTKHGNYTTKSGYYVAREIKYGRAEAKYMDMEDWKSF